MLYMYQFCEPSREHDEELYRVDADGERVESPTMGNGEDAMSAPFTRM